MGKAELAALRKAAEELGGLVRSPAPTPMELIEWLGGLSFRCGGRPPRNVSESESQILRAFLKHPTMSERQLVRESGYADARRILRRFTERFEGEFSGGIRLPGRKCEGGYHVNIRDACESPT
jgi:hypothetical protein